VSGTPSTNQRRPALRAALILGLLALATATPLSAHREPGLGQSEAPRLEKPPRFEKPLALDKLTLSGPSFARPWFASISETAWITAGVESKQSFRLAPPPTLALLGRYLRPWENHTPEWRAFREGAYGIAAAPSLTWRLTEAPEPAALPVRVTRPCPRWMSRALTVVRYAGESERLPLFDCDGGIAPDVIDRLSILSRAPGTPRPELPLPDQAASGVDGEWLPGIHLLDPRLVWAIGKLGAAFPGKRVVIMSGYRPDAHTSYHRRGKAVDLYVDGVDNASVFAMCRTLHDVGCGYYPNNLFVHLDVRAFGEGRVLWVDASMPGEPSRYVDGWAGVLERGRGWMGKGTR
jgi:hypothetical protein